MPFRLAYLFISHDLTAVRRVCSLAAIMCLSEIIETGFNAGFRTGEMA